MARQKLDEQVKAKRVQELTAKGHAPESATTFQIEPEARERLLRAAFVEQFGTNIAEITPILSQPLRNSPNGENVVGRAVLSAPRRYRCPAR